MKVCAVICRKAIVMLSEANFLSPWCQFPFSRAQNRGFCAFLAFGTPIFGHFEHKIGVFVRFCQQVFPDYGFYGLPVSSIFPMAPPTSNKPHLAEKISGLASNLAHLGRIC